MINFSYMMRLKTFRLVTSPNILIRHVEKSQEISWIQRKMELKCFFLQPQFVNSKQDSDIIQAE